MKKFTSKLLLLLLLTSGVIFAQEQKTNGAETSDEAAKEAAVMALAKATQNPVADMSTVPVQFNYYTGGGLGHETMSITNVQPVLPLKINENWNLIFRTIVPIVSLPSAGDERIKGIADIQEQIFLSPMKTKKVVWGFGPTISLPTATAAPLSTGQFAMGPSVVALAMPGKWVVGAVVNNLWKIAGNDDTTPINSFFAQPFINYNLKLGWSISTSPAITANWQAESGDQWTVPIGLGISKVAKVGNQPISILMQYYHNAIRPDTAGEDQVRLQVAFLFPNKK
jgi:hypothetical protein